MKKRTTENLWRKTGFAIRGFQKLLKDHSDYERLCLLYQMIMRECQYDKTLKRHFSHSYIGGLRDRTAVCSGFSELMLLLVDQITDYEIYYICGKANLHRDSYHAWNLIQVEDGTFFLDVTWDLGKKTPEYFLKTAHEMKGRAWDIEHFPAVSRTKFEGEFYRNEETLTRLRFYFRKLEIAFNKTGDFTVD